MHAPYLEGNTAFQLHTHTHTHLQKGCLGCARGAGFSLPPDSLVMLASLGNSCLSLPGEGGQGVGFQSKARKLQSLSGELQRHRQARLAHCPGAPWQLQPRRLTPWPRLLGSSPDLVGRQLGRNLCRPRRDCGPAVSHGSALETGTYVSIAVLIVFRHGWQIRRELGGGLMVQVLPGEGVEKGVSLQGSVAPHFFAA